MAKNGNSRHFKKALEKNIVFEENSERFLAALGPIWYFFQDVLGAPGGTKKRTKVTKMGCHVRGGPS